MGPDLEGRAAPPTGTAGLGGAPPPAPLGGLGLLAVYLGAQLGGLLLVGGALALTAPAGAAAQRLLLVRLTYWLSSPVLLAAGLVGLRLGRLRGRVRLAAWPGILAVLLGAGAGLVFKLCGDLVAAVEQLVTGPISGNNPLTLYPHAFSGAADRWLLGVTVVVVAPAAEELFFRAMLFGWLRQRLSRWPAALAAGALFGLAHVEPTSVRDLAQTLPLAVPLGAVGVGLCLLYDRYRSLWVDGAAHAVFNLTSIAVVLWP